MTDLSVLAARAAAILTARRETIAVCESSAGGLIAAALVAVPGASACFVGGLVVYTGAAREALLGIAPSAMAGMRSASEPYARLLADTACARLGTRWAIAETGASGPAGNRYGDAPGHACLAVAGPNPRVLTLETGSSDRAANMQAFAVAAMTLLLDALPG
jgi:nicotinamide-nucleotide amidase